MNLTVWLGSAAIACSFPILWWAFQNPQQSSSRAARANLATQRRPNSYREAVLERPATERLLDPILSKLASVAARFLPSTWFNRVDERLATSGLIGRFRGEQVIGAKVLGVIIVLFIFGARTVAEPSASAAVRLALAVAGVWFVPDLLLTARGDRRVDAIDRELPDILDQLTISVEAGLGFEAAMARIGERADTNLAQELARTMQDIQLGVSRLDALEGLSSRTRSNDVRSFVLALRQSERMGVPLAKTLRIQAQEMRSKRRLRAEEAAYKLPVKMIFPLGLCILPALFIVILAPAFIQISDLF